MWCRRGRGRAPRALVRLYPVQGERRGHQSESASKSAQKPCKAWCGTDNYCPPYRRSLWWRPARATPRPNARQRAPALPPRGRDPRGREGFPEAAMGSDVVNERLGRRCAQERRDRSSVKAPPFGLGVDLTPSLGWRECPRSPFSASGDLGYSDCGECAQRGKRRSKARRRQPLGCSGVVPEPHGAADAWESPAS
jgi:hypothetical protein